MKLSRELYSALFALVGVLVFFTSVKRLLVFSIESGLFSYIPLIPVISSYMIFLKRKEIRNLSAYCIFKGSAIVLIACCILTFAFVNRKYLSEYDYLILTTLSFVIWCAGGFVLFCGVKAFRYARFSLFFLLFTVPIPQSILGGLITILQFGSIEMTDFVFRILQVPFSRNGSVFHLAGINIEVVQACSGIRSFLVLLMISLLAGDLFLAKARSKLLLTLAVMPIAVFKNSLRIATLSLIAAYVDKGILRGPLHTRGGVLFFIFALVFMAPILIALRRLEVAPARSET